MNEKKMKKKAWVIFFNSIMIILLILFYLLLLFLLKIKNDYIEDPLARAVRKHLKKRNIEGGVSVAYSTEKPHHVKLLPLGISINRCIMVHFFIIIIVTIINIFFFFSFII